MVKLSRFEKVCILVMTAECFGCGGSDRPNRESVDRSVQSPVAFVAEDDPKMLAAIKMARDTADGFITALKSPKPTQKMFAVKMPIRDGSNIEHMWVLPVQFLSGKFVGRINNDPEKVKGVKLGQIVEVPKDQISDWMYVEGKKLTGGYTFRALRDAMPKAERVEFDKSVPFVIE